MNTLLLSVLTMLISNEYPMNELNNTQQEHAVQTTTNPVEVGVVDWGRDIDSALIESEELGRPLFVLFQEVPGCAGCQQFGQTVLTNPLLVEAIEDEFIPVLIHNNKPGQDQRTLERFNEPAWNYQVVRFLDHHSRDLIPRKDKVWTTAELTHRMVVALQAAKRPVPRYLQALAQEHDTDNHETVTLAMHCFWTGEYELGAIDGVITTEAGWLDGSEVTKVVFDSTVISLEELTTKASAAQCADKVYTDSDPASNSTLSYRRSQERDQKKQIQNWAGLKSISTLTEMQRTKINALWPTSRDQAYQWLSPRQRRALAYANAAANQNPAKDPATDQDH